MSPKVVSSQVNSVKRNHLPHRSQMPFEGLLTFIQALSIRLHVKITVGLLLSLHFRSPLRHMPEFIARELMPRHLPLLRLHTHAPVILVLIPIRHSISFIAALYSA
ncbi:unnamed protein product [Protopolystoma xenopodis]|uniref:Uncharacterized protein n=1 Tax=Protopolystoma xenopodis TaxID=117903 RepID=A0A448XCN5_9PLAT|nr:unnamed protein product [Protopolystoma xenopodis]